MKNILMVCYGGGHVKVIAPLYSNLKEDFKVTVLALTAAGPYLRDRSIPYVGISSFDFLMSEDVLRYGNELAAGVERDSVVSRDESVAYLGRSFLELVESLGSEEAAYAKYKLEGRSCFLPVQALRQIIQFCKADIVVTTNSPRAERASLIAAKELCIPAVCINDNLWISGGVVQVAKGCLADKICVLSSGVKDRLIEESGIPSESVVVTGTPVFDPLKNYHARRLLDRKQGRKVKVLFADGDLPEVHANYAGITNINPKINQSVRESLNNLSRHGLIDAYLRPHPNQSIDYSEYSDCIVSNKEQDLHELLLDIDVVVTAISTVGIEAKVMGLGLVSLENTIYTTRESYARLGMSTGIENALELPEAIQREYSKLSQNQTPSVVYEGSAVGNISEVIKSTLSVVAQT